MQNSRFQLGKELVNWKSRKHGNKRKTILVIEIKENIFDQENRRETSFVKTKHKEKSGEFWPREITEFYFSKLSGLPGFLL